MKILIISQVFWPDDVAVSLFVSDLSFELAANGYEVNALSGQYPYEHNTVKYPLEENHLGVEIKRLRNTSLGKKMSYLG